MRTRFIPLAIAAAASLTGAAGAQDRDPRTLVHDRVVARTYQGRSRGPEQTEQFSRKVKIGRDGRVSVSNIAGDITVTGGGGDEVSIEATKRTRGDRSELASLQIIVEDRA